MGLIRSILMRKGRFGGKAMPVEWDFESHSTWSMGPPRTGPKGVEKAPMERYVIKAILKICAECLLFATVTAVAIGILGYLRKWDSPLTYSNAFFLAGCLFIIAGGLSRQAAGEDWNRYQLSSGEGFQGMSTSERANFIVNISSPVRHIVIGLLTGILLILLSAVAGYLL